MRKVSADIFAAAGVRRAEDLLTNGDPEVGWRWLTAVAETAARRGDLHLAGQVFAFTSFWNLNIAHLLGPADWLELCLSATPKDLEARIAAAALPCLLQLPPGHVVTGNETGQLTADALAFFAAKTLTDYQGTEPAVTAEILEKARQTVSPEPPPEAKAAAPWLEPAVRQLSKIKNLLDEAGLKYADLGEGLNCVGVGLTWDKGGWAVVSMAAGGLEDAVTITVGVLKDVTQDRPTVLDACNATTRDNPTYPIFLHDAQQGWDVLVQQQFHVDLVLTNPDYFRGCLANLPRYAELRRPDLRKAGIEGLDYTWNDENLRRLLIRSTA
ncbi:hypothetical protein [Amycolatopsis sp. lyj-346]|uniref:hypothetical protein n=1 Tax=Amycolatopsis sp. lyj-346 TaxID=2789289 RepID=UPI0039790CD9